MPHAKIKTHQATLTLEQLHAELGGKIIDNRSEARRLARDMMHVEAVLKMLDPSYNVRGIAVRRRKPNPWFKRGTILRNAMDVLRTAERPLTGREIGERMLAAKGVKDPDKKAARELWGAVNSSLVNHDGKTVQRVGEGMPTRWKLL